MNYFIRLIVYVCLYTWLVVGLGYGQCGKQVFNPDTGLLDCTGVTGSGGVGGAAALTTAGAIPLVSSAGTLTQDAGFTFTSAGKTLGVAQGTITSQSAALSSTATWNNSGVTFTHFLANVTDTASATNSNLMDLQIGGVSRFAVRKDGANGSQLILSAPSSRTMKLSTYSNGFNYLQSTGAEFALQPDNKIYFFPYGASSSVFTQTVSGGAYVTGIGYGNISPTGTASILDRTAMTGATLEQIGTDGTNTSATTTRQVIRAGQAQSTTKLTEWQANAGGVIAAVGPGGGFITAATAAETLANSQCTFHLASNTQLTFTCKGSDGTLRTNTLTLI